MTEEIRYIANLQRQEEFDNKVTELEDELKRLEQERDELKKQNAILLDQLVINDGEDVTELKQENKSLYEEKNCLHKIIDRLLENAGYSKDIASAEDFEDVYEDMQIKRNELIELEQENKELKAYKDVNEDFKKAWDELNKKYIEVLKLAKENADSNEYCLQELEKENKELKDKITTLESEIRQKKMTIMMNNDHYLTVDENNRKYRSALEEIRKMFLNQVAWVGQLTNFEEKIYNKINEVINKN